MNEIIIGPYTVNCVTNTITATNYINKLDPITTRLLEYFVTHMNQVLKKEDISKAILGNENYSEEELSKVISELRTALREDEKNPKYIHEVEQIGYKFDNLGTHKSFQFDLKFVLILTILLLGSLLSIVYILLKTGK